LKELIKDLDFSIPTTSERDIVKDIKEKVCYVA